MSHYIMYFDGSYKSYAKNQLAFSYLLLNNKNRMIVDQNVFQVNTAKPLENTVNTAEFLGLIAGLKVLLAKELSDVTIYGDSKTVIDSMTGLVNIRAKNLRPLLLTAQTMIQYIADVDLQWVPSKQNLADRLCKR